MNGKEKNYETCLRLITLVVSDVPHYTCHFPENISVLLIIIIIIIIIIINKRTVSGICTMRM